MRKYLACIVAAAGIAIASASSAQAYIFSDGPDAGNVLTTDQGAVHPVGLGWYLRTNINTGRHDFENTNYAVGKNEFPGDEFHDFFVFSIAGFSGPVTSASLTLNTLSTYLDGDGAATVLYTLHDVSTPVADLEATNSNRGDIWTDLGTGTIYGTQTYTAADTYTYKTITLNADFITALNAAIASGADTFALGGELTGVPEPASWAMMLIGFGAVGFAMRSRKAAGTLA